MNKIYLTSLFSLCILFISCDKVLLDEELPNTPKSNFESIWAEFQAKYGLFQIKGIDWDSVYQVYEPQLENTSTDAELYAVLVDMLAGLDDSHVALVPTDKEFPFFQSGIVGQIDEIDDFDLEVLKNNYLTDAKFADPFFTYGMLEGDIGYIHVEGFSDLPANLEAPMDEVLEALKDAKGIIIDIRGGYGGEDFAGQYIAGRFTDQRRPYMRTRVKSGPGAEEFTDFEDWSIEPEGEFQYLKAVVVLTHNYTISARETFGLALKVLPGVIFVGERTAGAFSNQINREMPNGWGYSLSIGDWRDAEGVSHESIGLIPDIEIKNTKSDLLEGKDMVLEKAIELLQ